MSNAIRWSLVTAGGCISCAIAGHFLSDASAVGATIMLTVIFSMFGGAAIAD